MLLSEKKTDGRKQNHATSCGQYLPTFQGLAFCKAREGGGEVWEGRDGHPRAPFLSERQRAKVMGGDGGSMKSKAPEERSEISLNVNFTATSIGVFHDSRDFWHKLPFLAYGRSDGKNSTELAPSFTSMKQPSGVLSECLFQQAAR